MERERQITRSIEAKQTGQFVEADYIEAESRKAIGLPHIDDDEEPVWLPKSQIHAMEGEDGRVYAYVPDWLCRRKEIEMIEGNRGGQLQ